jgi:uncharacterized protein (TIGR00251 family)
MKEFFKIIDNNKAELLLKVRANARINMIKPFENILGKLYLKIYVTTTPEDGKANNAIIALLSRTIQIRKSDLEITKGQKSSDKVLEIKNIHLYSLKEIFKPYID